MPLVLPDSMLPHVLGLWPDFLLGVAVFAAMGSTDNRAKLPAWYLIAAIGALGIAGTIMDKPWLCFGGGRRLATAVFASLLVALHPFDRHISTWLVVRLLSAAGAISCSLYLVHVPLLSRTLNLGLRRVSSTSAGFVLLCAFAVGLALLGGFLFHRCVERPLERWRRSLFDNPPPVSQSSGI